MTNWSINLETAEYIENRAQIVEDAMIAIEETGIGYYVNLAVAHQHGNPDNYLVPALVSRFGETIKVQFIDQCGCGGYVYRVTRLHSSDSDTPPVQSAKAF